MKLVEMKCKNCGAKLKVNAEVKEANCQFCGTEFKIDDEVQHHKLDDAEQMGYELEKGKIRAREEAKQAKIEEQNAILQAKIEEQKAILQAQYEEEKRKKNLKWWIIGWIFFFPIPLTILIWKSKWDQKKKIIATVVLWGVLLLIGTLSPNDTTSTETSNSKSGGTEQVETDVNINDTFIKKYNANSSSKIENVTAFDAQDKESGYYRTEFRLNAFENNSSIHGTIANGTIDLINYGSLGEKDKFRLYASTDGEEQMKEIFKKAINIMDSSISDDEINEEINEAIKIKDNRFVLKGNVDSGYIMFTKGKWEILIDSNIEFAK